MDIVKVVEQWILLHAVRKKCARVLHCFSHKVDKPLLEWFPPCVLETFTLFLIVQKRDVKNYETAISIVLDLYPAISDVVKPGVVAKIVDALKIVMLFELLKENNVDEKRLVEKINKYFPRSCRGTDTNEPSDLKQNLTKHCTEYRRLFLKLTALPQYRQSFMTHRYSKQFGRRFEMRLADLVQRIVTAVDNKLPLSPIEKILHDDSIPSIRTRLSELKIAVIEILLDHCVDKDQLTEADCLQLLDIFRPSPTSQPSQDDLWHAKSSYYSSQSDAQMQSVGNPVSVPVLSEESMIVPSSQLVSSLFDHVTPSGHVLSEVGPVTSSQRGEKRNLECLNLEDSPVKRSFRDMTCVNRDTDGQTDRVKVKWTSSFIASTNDMDQEAVAGRDELDEDAGIERSLKRSGSGSIDYITRSSESEKNVSALEISIESHPDNVNQHPSVTTGRQQTDDVQLSDSEMEFIIVLSDDDDDEDGAMDTDGGSTSEWTSCMASTSKECSTTRQVLQHTATLQHTVQGLRDKRTDVDDEMKYDSSEDDDTELKLICSSSPASTLVSQELSSPIVPSSFSIDKFNTIVCSPEDVIRSTLPSIGKHLRSSLIKTCIVKLKHNKMLDGCGDSKENILWFS